MKKLIIHIVLLYSSSHLAYSQKEANWWICNFAGITFESGIPIDSLNNALGIAFSTMPGSFNGLYPQSNSTIATTISDYKGQLQIYNLGGYFFNRHHEFLKGADSSVHILKTPWGIISHFNILCWYQNLAIMI